MLTLCSRAPRHGSSAPWAKPRGPVWGSSPLPNAAKLSRPVLPGTCLPISGLSAHQVDSISGFHGCQVAQGRFGRGDGWCFQEENLILDGDFGGFDSWPLPTNTHTRRSQMGLSSSLQMCTLQSCWKSQAYLFFFKDHV